MAIPLFVKALLAWCILMLLAVANGLLRENVLDPLLGERRALPVSGITLSILILGVTQALLPWFGPLSDLQLWLLGGFWLLLTIGFEFAFGRTVVERSWPQLLAAYDITSGNLWLLVLLTTTAAPWLASRLS
jgi:hypothetical protein